MIPAAAFLVGFALGFWRAVREGDGLPDRLHRGFVTGLAFTLVSLFLGFLFEAVIRA